MTKADVAPPLGGVPEVAGADVQAVLTQLSEGVILADVEGRISFINAAAERLHGVKALEIGPAEYASAYRLLTEGGEPYPWRELPLSRAALQGETVEDARWRIRRPDGSEILAIGSAAPIRDAAGRQTGAMLTLRDDTERRRVERALGDNEARLRALTDNLPGGMIFQIATGRDGRERRFLYVSPSVLELTGIAAEAVLADPTIPYEQILHEDRPALIDAEAAAIRSVQPFEVEARFRRADGEIRWCRITSRPRPQSDGSLIWDGVQIDITDQKTAISDLEATSRRLDAILNNTRMAVFVMDHRHQCVCANAAAESLTGYSFGQLQGRPLHDVIHNKRPDGSPYPLSECPIDRAFPERAQMSGEELFVAPDGSFYPVAFTASPLLNDVGQPIGTVIEAKNIAAEKMAEAERVEQARTLAVLNDSGAMLASELDLDRLVQKVTDAGVELTGARFGAFFYNVLSEGGERLLLYTLSGAERADFERFGMPRPTPVFAPTFHGEGVVRSADILSDARYGQMEPHRGMPKGHLPVRSYLAVPVTSRSGEVIGGLFFGHPETNRFESRHEELIVGLASQAAVAMDNARLFQAAQQANAELEERVAERTAERDRMWRLSSDLMLVASFDATITAVNPAWSALLGYAEGDLLGRSFLDLVHAEDLDRTIAEAGKLGEGLTTSRFENRYKRKDGEYVWLSWTAVPDEGSIHAVGRDITAEKAARDELIKAQEALRQAQKMEAVGQLTGGIAHDFNNLLQGILGSLNLVQKRIASGRLSEVDRFITGAVTSANRAAALTHRLLAFSRRQPLDPKPVRANQLVASMEDLLRRTLGEHIELELVLAGGLWVTLCDPNQLESALLNLAINGRDAMPGGGKLTIETCNAHLDHHVARQRDIKPGQYVCVCVTDTGSGMTPDVIERAFDPFFTTKPIGQGTGLGLSMIYGFARQSEGYAKIYSEVGQGTTVKLYLPRDRAKADQSASDEDQPQLTEAHHAGEGETVLVVEDEPVVRGLIVEVLDELGYRALEAVDGPSGLEILRNQSRRIDLLVTDIGLPGLNGRQLADAGRVLRPTLKVLFMTGYAENATLANGFLDAGMAMITKPFAIEHLATRIREIIEGEDGT